MEVESICNFFEFFTRKESESNLVKIVRTILSVMVSKWVDKAEKVLSVQRHHSSADDKTTDSWKTESSLVNCSSNRHRDQTAILSCSEAKVSSIWV